MGEFETRLRAMGMQVKPMMGDGNCLFRTLSDQLEQKLKTIVDHQKLRREIVDYISEHRSVFEPFLDSDVESIDKYCKRMSRDGVYGGYLELNAVTRLFQVDALILQDDGYVYKIKACSDAPAKCCLRLAYRSSYEHYDSVIITNGDNYLHLSDDQVKNVEVPEWMLQIVVKSTGVSDSEALKALQKHNSKVDDTIEFLLSKDVNDDEEEQEEQEQDKSQESVKTSDTTKGNDRKLSARERKEKAKKERKQRKTFVKQQQSRSDKKTDQLAAKINILDI